MIPQSERLWETHVHHTAQKLTYPPTPDLTTLRRPQRRSSLGTGLGWVAVILVILLLVGLSVPPVRAGVLEWLQVGPVRVWLVAPTPTPTPTVLIAATVTPQPTPTPLLSVLDLAGETTLADARDDADFPIRLPTYPPDLGLPDRVFLQDLEGTAVILVWLEPGASDKVRMSLHELASGAFVWKMEPTAVEETSVHGQRALWVDGPYYLLVQQPQSGQTWANRRLIRGHVLVWTEMIDGMEIVYRLETDLSLEEAIRVAESLSGEPPQR